MHLLKSVLPKSLNPAQCPRIDIYLHSINVFILEFVAIDDTYFKNFIKFHELQPNKHAVLMRR